MGSASRVDKTSDLAPRQLDRCVGCGRYANDCYAKPLAIGVLPARLRAEPRTGSLRLVRLAALLTDSRYAGPDHCRPTACARRGDGSIPD